MNLRHTWCYWILNLTCSQCCSKVCILICLARYSPRTKFTLLGLSEDYPASGVSEVSPVCTCWIWPWVLLWFKSRISPFCVETKYQGGVGGFQPETRSILGKIGTTRYPIYPVWGTSCLLCSFSSSYLKANDLMNFWFPIATRRLPAEHLLKLIHKWWFAPYLLEKWACLTLCCALLLDSVSGAVLQ